MLHCAERVGYNIIGFRRKVLVSLEGSSEVEANSDLSYLSLLSPSLEDSWI